MQLMKQFLFLPAQFTEYRTYNVYVMFLLTYYVISIFFFFCTRHIDRLSLRLAIGQLAQ